jgi:glycogen operon protein
MFNAYWEPLVFELPSPSAGGQQAWRRCVDTALESPHDIQLWRSAFIFEQSKYTVQPRSVVLLALALDSSLA